MFFGKREIRDVDLGTYPSSSRLRIRLKGYSVAVIEFRLIRLYKNIFESHIPLHPIWRWIRYVFPLSNDFLRIMIVAYNDIQRILAIPMKFMAGVLKY